MKFFLRTKESTNAIDFCVYLANYKQLFRRRRGHRPKGHIYYRIYRLPIQPLTNLGLHLWMDRRSFCFFLRQQRTHTVRGLAHRPRMSINHTQTLLFNLPKTVHNHTGRQVDVLGHGKKRVQKILWKSVFFKNSIWMWTTVLCHLSNHQAKNCSPWPNSNTFAWNYSTVSHRHSHHPSKPIGFVYSPPPPVKNHPAKTHRFCVLPPWKNHPLNPLVLCTPPFEKSPIKAHRFCVLLPLKNHNFWWVLISGERIFTIWLEKSCYVAQETFSLFFITSVVSCDDLFREEKEKIQILRFFTLAPSKSVWKF